MTVNQHTVVNFKILSTVEEVGFSNLIGERTQWEKKERKELLLLLRNTMTKHSRDERTLKRVSFHSYFILLYKGLAVIEIAEEAGVVKAKPNT